MNESYIIPVFVGGTLFLTLFAISLIFLLIQHKRRQVRHELEKINLEHQYETQLLQTQLEVQEQSFKHFSEEIHDNIGQVLALVKYHLYNIAEKSSENQVIIEAHESTELLTDAVQGLRNLSHTLSSSYVAQAGLVAALEKEMTHVRSARRINCLLETSGHPVDLGENRELLVFRIIQEAVGNALKHGAAQNVTVSLRYEQETLAVCISDDGRGFDIFKPRSADAGIGLDNMRTRARMLGSELHIQSAIQKGTTLHFQLPVTHE